MIHKRIRLYPTEFTLDVFVGDVKEDLANEFKKKYGSSYEYWLDYIVPNCVYKIKAEEDSEGKGSTEFAMSLTKFKHGVIAHECVHVVHELAHHIGLSTGYKSTEWFAYMVEYIFDEIEKMETKLEPNE